MSWKFIKRETIVENRFLSFRVDDFETSSGYQGKYWFHDGGHAAVVFARAADGRFVMIREYRYLFDRISIESPAGTIEPGEEPIAAAAREFEEETGFRVQSLKAIGTIATAPAFSKEVLHVFAGEGVQTGIRHADPSEDIEPVFMTAQEIDEAIASGEIWDGTTLGPWNLAKLYFHLN